MSSNRKTVLFALAAAFAAGAWGAALTPEQIAERKAKVSEMIEKAKARTGGLCVKPGKGAVAVVDCQKRIGEAALGKAIRYLHGRLPVEIRTLRGTCPPVAGKVALPEGCAAAVYLVDEGEMAMSLIAPEGHWGVLNVARIATKSDALTEDRLVKEFLRVAVMAYGGGTSHYEGSILQKVSEAEDLDGLGKPVIPIEQLGGMKRNLEALGVVPSRKATYQIACKEGWAPQPTNDVQKAIWEKVHAIPQKPIKIEFDPKRDKGK